ncbi:MAG: Smr/MutS family protein [Xanthomonadales bacterium]|nr:Smr/MutS family protein [Xanthomonadales bacterium]
METGEELLHLRPGLPQALLRRLRRGHYAVRDELDLHSLDAPTAAALLKRFLDEARREGRLVRQDHPRQGAPLPRGPGPVLRGVVDRLLRLRGDVLAFAPARPAQGGSGATLVLLAPRRGGRTRAATRPRPA